MRYKAIVEIFMLRSEVKETKATESRLTLFGENEDKMKEKLNLIVAFLNENLNSCAPKGKWSIQKGVIEYSAEKI